MKATSANISALWPTDEQVVIYLGRHYPHISQRLHDPPEFVRALFKNQIQAAQEGWMTKGQECVHTLWTFCIRSYDLEHLSFLDGATISSRKKTSLNLVKIERVDDMTNTINQFDALRIDDTEDGYVKVEEGATDSTMFKFMFAETTLTPEGISRRIRPLPARSSSSLPQQEEAKPSVPERPMSVADALATKSTFLRHFGMDDLPRIPNTMRSVPELLADGRIWAFSVAEREEFREWIAVQAKKEVEQTELAPLAKVVEEYEQLRKAFESSRQEVSHTVTLGIRLMV